MTWALQLWTLTILGSLLLARGLTQALRGAFVGGGAWITKVDFIGARLSQLAAIATILLLVHLGLSAIRVARSTLLALGAALLASAPTLMLMLAQKRPLPGFHACTAALCGASAMLLCAYLIKERPLLRAWTLLGGLSLLSLGLASTSSSALNSPTTVSLLEASRSLLAFLAVILVLAEQGWRDRKKAWVPVTLLAVSFLLSLTASAATKPDASVGWLLTGRTLTELAPHTLLGALAPLAISSAILSLLWSLLTRPASLSRLTTALIALGMLAPTSPLVIAWLTLCGLVGLLISQSYDLTTDFQSAKRTNAAITMIK